MRFQKRHGSHVVGSSYRSLVPAAAGARGYAAVRTRPFAFAGGAWGTAGRVLGGSRWRRAPGRPLPGAPKRARRVLHARASGVRAVASPSARGPTRERPRHRPGYPRSPATRTARHRRPGRSSIARPRARQRHTSLSVTPNGPANLPSEGEMSTTTWWNRAEAVHGLVMSW